MPIREDIPRPLRVAIIGCGAVVQRLHMPVLQNLAAQGAVQVMAVVDTATQHTDVLRRAFPSAQPHSDVSHAFADCTTDLTLVASPPGLHREHAELALSRGSDVLCEKPLCTKSIDARALAAAASACGRILAVGMTFRFMPSLATAAEIVASGELGDNLRFVYRGGDAYDWPVTSDAPFRRATSGGGVLTDKGVHFLDALYWIFGPLTVESAWDDSCGDGVEGNSVLRMTGHGVHGTVQMSWDQAMHNGLWIQGSRAAIMVQPWEFRFVHYRTGDNPWVMRGCSRNWAATWQRDGSKKLAPTNYEDLVYLQWIAMLRATTLGEAMPVGADTAAVVIEQLETAYGMARSVDQSWLAEAERTKAASLHWNHIPTP